MKEEIIYVTDSLGVSHPETFEKAGWSLSQTFVEGGMAGMIAITLVVGIFWMLSGLSQALGVLQMVGDISPALLCGGLKVTLIPVLYGLIVYFISLIIRVIQKPRI